MGESYGILQLVKTLLSKNETVLNFRSFLIIFFANKQLFGCHSKKTQMSEIWLYIRAWNCKKRKEEDKPSF